MSIFLLTLIAAIVSMILGAVWYMPLFGKHWAKATGREPRPDGQKATMKMMAIPLVLNFVANLLMSFVVFLILAGFGAATIPQALITSGVLFLGFAVPFTISSILWKGYSKKSQWVIFGVSAGFQLINFAVWALIFVWLM